MSDARNAGIPAIAAADLLGFYKSFRPKTVLDLGCGEGCFLKEVLAVLPAYERALGVDPKPEALASARALFSGEPRASFLCSGAESLSLDDSSVDLIIMSYSLHHLARPREALAEASRVLAAEGALVLQDFVDQDLNEAQRLREEFHMLRGEIGAAMGGFMRPIYRIAEIEELLAGAGFRRERACLALKEAEPGPQVSPRLREAIRKETAGLGDRAVREAFLVRAEGIIARIESAGFHLTPTYLGEWRKGK
jgi:SAM-dependent methyltransferase